MQINNKVISESFYALGTINNIKIFQSDKKDSIVKVIDRVTEIHKTMSAFLVDNDIARIRSNAGCKTVKVQEDTYYLIEKAIRFGTLSSGTFDITIRPLVELWGINKKGSYIPENNQIEEALKYVNYQDILLDGARGIMLKKHGQSIDLGGIAKGYAADEVKRILLENGVNAAIINLGGNILVLGQKPNGMQWKVGIQNPLAPTGQYLGTLTVSDKTIVTSGCNERFFIKDGIRYHHILDPTTGKPAESNLLSVTAVCSCSADADALTTALFILGPEKSTRLLREFNAEAVFIQKDLSVIITEGLKNGYKHINSQNLSNQYLMENN